VANQRAVRVNAASVGVIKKDAFTRLRLFHFVNVGCLVCDGFSKCLEGEACFLGDCLGFGFKEQNVAGFVWSVAAAQAASVAFENQVIGVNEVQRGHMQS
jgi:hypothetical protein